MPYSEWVKSQAPRLVDKKARLVLHCGRCDTQDTPRLKRSGPHTSGYCKYCGAFIKHIPLKDLAPYPAYQQTPPPSRDAQHRYALEQRALADRLNLLLEDDR